MELRVASFHVCESCHFQSEVSDILHAMPPGHCVECDEQTERGVTWEYDAEPPECDDIPF